MKNLNKNITNEKNKAFIYVLEKNNVPFYIGKTRNPKRREYDWKVIFGEDIYFYIIDECLNLKIQWKFLESYWICQFKVWGFILLNKNEGGGGLTKHSEDVIEKIRQSKIGIKQQRTKVRKDKGKKHILDPDIKVGVPKGWVMSEETRKTKNLKQKNKPKHSIESKKKIGEFHKGKDNFGNKGKKLKEEHKRKSAEGKYKPVLQYDLQGNFIKEYSSLKEVRITFKGDIQSCCVGKQKTSCGYIWKYKNK